MPTVDSLKQQLVGYQTQVSAGSSQTDKSDNQQRDLAPLLRTFLTGDGLGSMVQADGLLPTSVHAETRLNDSPEATMLNAGEYVLGGYCDIYGQSHMAADGPGAGEGEGGEEVLVESIDIPDLIVASQTSDLTAFTMPSQQSSSVTTTGGSFTAQSLVTPDLTAEGINWVHQVVQTWTSSTQWSFEERLVLAYNVTNSADDSGDLSDLEYIEEGGGGSPEPDDEDFTETGTWDSTVSSVRSGYVFFRIFISRGITTPAAAGVGWTVDISSSDSITVAGTASGDSVITATNPPTEADDPMRDFTGESTWSAGYSVTASIEFELDLEVTPVLLPDNSQAWNFTLTTDSDSSGSTSYADGYTAGTYSGDLSRTGQPLGPSSNPLAFTSTSGGDYDLDPEDQFEGNGTASLSSGGGSASDSGSSRTGAQLQGQFKQGYFLSMTGGMFEALDNIKSASGDGHHIAILHENRQLVDDVGSWGHHTEHLTATLMAGWGGQGNAQGSEAVLDEYDVQLENGQPIAVISQGSTSSTGNLDTDVDMDGKDRLYIDATLVIDKRNYYAANPNSGMWTDTDHTLNLEYDYKNDGQAIGDLLGGEAAADNLGLTSDIEGDGFENLDVTSFMTVDYHVPSQSAYSPMLPWATEVNGVPLGDPNVPITGNVKKRDTILSTHRSWVVDGSVTVQAEGDNNFTVTVDGTETTHEVVGNSQDEEFLLNIVHVVAGPSGSGTTTEYAHLASRHMEFDSDLTYVLTMGGSAVSAVDGSVDQSNITASEAIAGTSPLMSVTGVDHFGQPWPQTGEFYQGEAPIYVPPGEDQPPIEPGSYPPNPSRTSTLLGWFAGSHGDVFDQTVDFASGFGDNVTFGATKAMRQWHGADYVNQDSWAYTGGDFAANFVPGPTAIAKPGTWAYKLYNKFDDVGGCANFFTKVIQGGCFVPGTLVTLSELPRDVAFEAALWGDDELSEELSCLGRSDNFQWIDDGSELALSSETTAVKSTRTLQLPIEQVPLGARVPTKNPRPWERDDSLPEPDEATWVVVSLTVQRSDGGIVDAELMRPRAWVEQHRIEVGQQLHLNIEELQVKGLAYVNSIQRVPRIASGDGSVITGRFVTRQVDVITRLEVLGADGQFETIEGTSIHPIWSLGRNDWVPLGEIEEGELLLGTAGAATVLALVVLHHVTPVYNIEVHREHVYGVGESGLLVHNTCAGYNDAMSQALGWLGKHGFDPTEAAPYASRSSIAWMNGAMNGFKNGKVGYRIEWDPKIGNHINVFAGKVIGPHFEFSGNSADVMAILRQIF